jgi:hypothetical protein
MWPPLTYCKHWYAWQGSNLRPPVPETGALSTELQAREGDSRTNTNRVQNGESPAPVVNASRK